MADLSTVLGGPWSPPPEDRIAPPEEQLRDAIRAAGLEPPDELLLDGKLHRFRSGTKGSAKLFAVLKRLGWPRDRYQLLCANCNFGKLMNGGVCPHQQREADCA